MTELGHTGGMGGTHVVRANDAYPQCHPKIFPQLAKRAGSAANAGQKPVEL
jgi:hypothetical protein